MKVSIALPNNEPEVKLRLVDNGDNGITVEDEKKGWALVTFCVVDEKVHLELHANIVDDRFATVGEEKKLKVLEN